MGIFGALTTAVSGLRAQAFALERISDNIANSQTTGYKRSDASFADFVPDSPARQQALGVVNAFSRTTNTIQGDVSNSEVDTHIAINGDGYFIISQQADTVDGLPVFSSETLYTRRGDFEFDRNGYLVNATGYFLQGLPIDPTTGNPSGSSPTVIRISNDFLPAITTTEINYRANLAEFPLTASSDPTVPGSELIVPGDYAVNPLNAGAGTGVVQANDVNIFINQTISGGAITAFDQAGASVNVQLRWAKTDNVTDTWNLFFLTDSAATGTDTAWKNIGQEYIFGSNSQLNPPIVSTTITALTVNGVNLGDVNLDHGSNGITQFADPNGVVKVTQISQNGSSAGQLVGTTISNEGRVVANYSNGRTVDLAEIVLASFNGDGGLAKSDGGAFRATTESGPAIIGALGTVVGSALEGSNTDIADEFTKLIVTQQAYAANTRIISTADEMVTEALNMIR